MNPGTDLLEMLNSQYILLLNNGKINMPMGSNPWWTFYIPKIGKCIQT